MKKEKSCGAVISKKVMGELYILLIKHKNGGHWAFPKGHVEKNETEIETAKREILEETGLNADIDTSFRKVVSYSPKAGVTKDVVYFSGQVKSGNESAQPEEVLDIEWKRPQEALKLVTFDNDKSVLKAYLEFINR